jgi:hypothetical protein
MHPLGALIELVIRETNPTQVSLGRIKKNNGHQNCIFTFDIIYFSIISEIIARLNKNFSKRVYAYVNQLFGQCDNERGKHGYSIYYFCISRLASRHFYVVRLKHASQHITSSSGGDRAAKCV